MEANASSIPVRVPDAFTLEIQGRVNVTVRYFSIRSPVKLDWENRQRSFDNQLGKAVRWRPDVLVLSFGHHFHRFHFPNEVSSSTSRLFASIIRMVRELLDNTLRGDTHVVWRTPSTRHFSGGEWNTGGTCGAVPRSDPQVVQARVFRDYISAFGRSHGNFTSSILDITDISSTRHDAHVGLRHGVWDCSHWCAFGLPMSWTVLLQRLLCRGSEFSPSASDPCGGSQRLAPAQTFNRTVFYHFCKAAGTSLKNQLSEHYSSLNITWAFAYGNGPYVSSFNQTTGLRSGVPMPKDAIDHRVRLVYGHYPHWNIAQMPLETPRVYVCALREPTSWAMSYFRYSMSKEHDYVINGTLSAAHMFMGRWKFKTTEVNWSPLCRGQWPCDLEVLRQTMKNNFYVLLSEHFDLSCELLKIEFGLPFLHLDSSVHANIASGQKAKSPFPLHEYRKLWDVAAMAHLSNIYGVGKTLFLSDVQNKLGLAVVS
mmetsp:Transcript_3612/g.7516  ORF Transcript_3612/g.7516 Transcript_3612/m.7516 type:complete len:482 (-) Transcript_3612:482-1927(-)